MRVDNELDGFPGLITSDDLINDDDVFPVGSIFIFNKEMANSVDELPGEWKCLSNDIGFGLSVFQKGGG